MINAVRHTMRRYALATEGEPLWVAVSGGVDSMVLWHVMRMLGHPCHVVHVDHGLRGSESDADREFVVAHGRALGVEVHVHKVAVREAATVPGTSTQMAARDMRYELFHQCVRQGPGTLAMAHHADDAAETFLIHLLRGMGSHGWASIPPRTGAFVRPLIECRRTRIEAYAKAHDIPFRSDSSNADPHYLRNRVRNELLPLMEELRPGSGQVLVRNVVLARELMALSSNALSAAAEAFLPDAEGVARLPLPLVRDSDAPHLLLHALLGPKGFHPDVLDQLLLAVEQRRTGAVFMQGIWRMTVDRDELVLQAMDADQRSWTIDGPDAVPADAPIRIGLCQKRAEQQVPGTHVVHLDPAQAAFPMRLRPWRAGDRMRPAGLHGSKLISDMLTDAKVPSHIRKQVLVLESGGRIIWLCGYRLAEGAKADPGAVAQLRLEWLGDRRS